MPTAPLHTAAAAQPLQWAIETNGASPAASDWRRGLPSGLLSSTYGRVSPKATSPRSTARTAAPRSAHRTT
ncbi:MAG: hypothetical protein QOJ93_213, partial [Actinomycetota bacterium]|nr:hypothetical protein [Actinomycetota bacterium]